MADDVKSTGSLRQEQAKVTRDRIAVAARTLFAANGYAATSMEAIARAAGVAPRTVYVAFGAKREILSAICEQWLEDAKARPHAEAVLALATARDRVRGAAGWLTALYSAGFDVVLILESARDEDSETRELLLGKLAGRNHVMDLMIKSVADDLVRPIGESTAMFRAMAAPGVYEALVVDAGWSTDMFADWLADFLVRELLGN